VLAGSAVAPHKGAAALPFVRGDCRTNGEAARLASSGHGADPHWRETGFDVTFGVADHPSAGAPAAIDRL
jgi:hypothetical protein